MVMVVKVLLDLFQHFQQFHQPVVEEVVLTQAVEEMMQLMVVLAEVVQQMLEQQEQVIHLL